MNKMDIEKMAHEITVEIMKEAGSVNAPLIAGALAEKGKLIAKAAPGNTKKGIANAIKVLKGPGTAPVKPSLAVNIPRGGFQGISEGVAANGMRIKSVSPGVTSNVVRDNAVKETLQQAADYRNRLAAYEAAKRQTRNARIGLGVAGAGATAGIGAGVVKALRNMGVDEDEIEQVAGYMTNEIVKEAGLFTIDNPNPRITPEEESEFIEIGKRIDAGESLSTDEWDRFSDLAVRFPAKVLRPSVGGGILGAGIGSLGGLIGAAATGSAKAVPIGMAAGAIPGAIAMEIAARKQWKERMGKEASSYEMYDNLLKIASEDMDYAEKIAEEMIKEASAWNGVARGVKYNKPAPVKKEVVEAAAPAIERVFSRIAAKKVPIAAGVAGAGATTAAGLGIAKAVKNKKAKNQELETLAYEIADEMMKEAAIGTAVKAGAKNLAGKTGKAIKTYGKNMAGVGKENKAVLKGLKQGVLDPAGPYAVAAKKAQKATNVARGATAAVGTAGAVGAAVTKNKVKDQLKEQRGM